MNKKPKMLYAGEKRNSSTEKRVEVFRNFFDVSVCSDENEFISAIYCDKNAEFDVIFYEEEFSKLISVVKHLNLLDKYRHNIILRKSISNKGLESEVTEFPSTISDNGLCEAIEKLYFLRKKITSCAS